jgi:hypothetical protein
MGNATSQRKYRLATLSTAAQRSLADHGLNQLSYLLEPHLIGGNFVFEVGGNHLPTHILLRQFNKIPPMRILERTKINAAPADIAGKMFSEAISRHQQGA